ncbi:MAG TPA: efflux RND transporter periplasmic adaptor subunit [Puia sp.]|nr:efflux RND transporter periplasmic adaptor subunit [Puia sp.]
MVNRKLRLYAFISGICIQLVSCGGDDKNNMPGGNMPGANMSEQVKDFRVLTLSPRTAKVNLDFPATLQGQQIIEIRPKIDGYLDAIYVKEGAAVKKGQLLFRISNPQYEQEVVTARASIKSAEADVDAAKMQVAKTKPLVDKEIVSKYELESADYLLKAKEASLIQAKASLQNALANVGYTVLRSPSDGVIGMIPYKVGALINTTNTSPLTTLANIQNIYAYYSLNEKQLLQYFENTSGSSIHEKISKMAPASLILADGTLYPEKGKIEMASGIIATETGTATFKALFSNPSGILRSGGSATVRSPTVINTALIIPQSATYEMQDKKLVYIVNGNNKISSTAFTGVPSDNGLYYIVTSGLKAGDNVVLEGLVGLRDSLQIIPKPENPDDVYKNFQ